MMTFYDEHQELSIEATEFAHQIALRVLHDDLDSITPTMLLDYAHAMRLVVSHLADNGFYSEDRACTHTVSQGPVVVEAEEDGSYRVFRFDRQELTPDDVTSDDMAHIIEAAQKVLH